MEQDSLQDRFTRYDYSQAGFDGFLTRSLDSTSQGALSMDTNPQSRQVAYDRGSASGAFADTFKVGNIVFDGRNSLVIINDENSDAAIIINGREKRIEILDTNNTRVLAGKLPDTSYGWAVSKPGVNVENGF